MVEWEAKEENKDRKQNKKNSLQKDSIFKYTEVLKSHLREEKRKVNLSNKPKKVVIGLNKRE
jgi:hypothetical protein